MEIAKEKGMRVGLVTNSMVYDASPAAFASHLPNRRNFAAIVKRYLELEPEVLLGGGKEQFLPKTQPGSRRSDDLDLIAAFVQKGYRYVANKQELEEAQHDLERLASRIDESVPEVPGRSEVAGARTDPSGSPPL